MSKHGLMDPMPLDNGEEPKQIKCGLCGFIFDEEKDKEDYEFVDEFGCCPVCDKIEAENKYN